MFCCRNKLKQQGLAAHNYADKHASRGDNFLPSAMGVNAAGAGNSTNPTAATVGWSHIVSILPYGEENNLSKTLMVSQRLWKNSSRTVIKFLCSQRASLTASDNALFAPPTDCTTTEAAEEVGGNLFECSHDYILLCAHTLA